MNGVPRVCVSVSTVTCRSSMHSSSADWVFGEARLISSPSTMLAKIAPGLNSKSPVSWLNTLTPVTSVGSRSGVNWIRRNEQSIDRAIDFASIVLPTPGTSSISRWPSATSATSASLISLCLPRTTCSTFSSIWRNRAANARGSGSFSRTSISVRPLSSMAGQQSYVREGSWVAPKDQTQAGDGKFPTDARRSNATRAGRPTNGRPERPLFATIRHRARANPPSSGRLHGCDSPVRIPRGSCEVATLRAWDAPSC